MLMIAVNIYDNDNSVNDKGKLYGMKINVKKTKSMVASKKQETPNVSINLDGTTIKQVKKWSTWVV